MCKIVFTMFLIPSLISIEKCYLYLELCYKTYEYEKTFKYAMKYLQRRRYKA